MWLAKIPQQLQEAWAEAPPGTVLGQLIFTKGKASSSNSRMKQNAKNTVSIHVNDASGRSSLPLDYGIEAMTKKVPGNLYGFRRSDEDGSIRVAGKVTRSCNLQVKQLESKGYKELLKNRLKSTVQTTRYVRPIDAADVSLSRDAAVAANESVKSFGNAIEKYGQEVIEQKNAADQQALLGGVNGKKRKFEPGQSMRSILFELYSSQKFWTVKEIRAACGYPDNEVRSVLQELCEFHRSGEQRGSWELKKEYQ